jgi:TRAP-type C4-dicarboxylate transport system permease small subunit
MSRRRRQSIAEDALELLFDLAGLYWQVGAFAGVMLLFFSFSTYTWIDEQYVKALSSPHLGQVAYSCGWVFYSIPLLILGIAIMFFVKSYRSYRREHYYG